MQRKRVPPRLQQYLYTFAPNVELIPETWLHCAFLHCVSALHASLSGRSARFRLGGAAYSAPEVGQKRLASLETQNSTMQEYQLCEMTVLH